MKSIYINIEKPVETLHIEIPADTTVYLTIKAEIKNLTITPAKNKNELP